MIKKKFPYLLTFISLIFLVFLVAIAFLIFNMIPRHQPSSATNQNNAEKPAAVSDGIEYYVPKPIPLVLMNLQEKEALGIDTSTESQIQILERTASGSVGVYRIIRKDRPILTVY